MGRGRVATIVIVVALVILAVVAVAASWFLARQSTLRNLTFVRVTAQAAARAMQEDHFYSDYGDTVLEVSGKVAAVEPAGDDTVISLETDTDYGLSCTAPTSTLPAPPTIGVTIIIVAPAGPALREPDEVAFPQCRVESVG